MTKFPAGKRVGGYASVIHKFPYRLLVSRADEPVPTVHNIWSMHVSYENSFESPLEICYITVRVMSGLLFSVQYFEANAQWVK